jgi:hypothetical protein
MSGPSSSAMSSKSCDNRSRIGSQSSYVSDIIDLTALAALATRMQTATDS